MTVHLPTLLVCCICAFAFGMIVVAATRDSHRQKLETERDAARAKVDELYRAWSEALQHLYVAKEQLDWRSFGDAALRRQIAELEKQIARLTGGGKEAS